MKWLFATVNDFPQAEYDRIWGSLTSSRKARIETLKHPDDKKRSLTGDLLVEKLLNGRIEMAPSGQPLPAGGGMHISLAHSADAVVCAVSETPVGIDIERIRPIDLAITRHICTPEEAEYLFGHPPMPAELVFCENPVLLQRFFEIWTAKEAYFKRMGTGITNLRSINILPLPRKTILKDDFFITVMD